MLEADQQPVCWANVVNTVSHWHLTQSEADACDQLVVGRSSRDAGEVLEIQAREVNRRLRRARAKTGSRDNRQLAQRWQEFRLRQWEEVLAQ